MPKLWDEHTAEVRGADAPERGYWSLDEDGAPWLMTTAELSWHIDRSLDWLYRKENIEAMERDHGMPKPHPAFADKKPIMYVRAEIRAWLRTAGPSTEFAPADAPGGGDPVLDARADAIARRAAG